MKENLRDKLISKLKHLKIPVTLLAILLASGATSTTLANTTSQLDTNQTISQTQTTSQEKQNTSKPAKILSIDGHEFLTENYPSELLPFTGSRQLEMGNLDHLKRATYSHIQLQDKDEPTGDREEKLTYNPSGWHNYQFYYGDGSHQAWLMHRGHLVGYQFSGLNDEPKNLVTETSWLNTGNYTGMNIGNTDSMLYYEIRLDSWLATHPNFWLDYKVTPIYDGDELVPRKIELQYVGLDENGKLMQIKIGGKENVDQNMITRVTIDNVSPNAIIDYMTGTATNTVFPPDYSEAPSTSSSSTSSISNEDQLVYVTSTGVKYHTHAHGTGKFSTITLKEALNKGLTPCQLCY